MEGYCLVRTRVIVTWQARERPVSGRSDLKQNTRLK